MIDIGERADASISHARKARKAHRCCECFRRIAAGEHYHVEKILFDGRWDTFRTCSQCRVAQLWLAENCGGYVFECAREEMLEHAREYRPLAFGLYRVAVGMRRGWRRFGRDEIMSPPKMPGSIASVVEPRAALGRHA
ncbi:hypothetical protein [Roseomonas populi]|uniref:Uncharacterized protein n=1 Tax=Roseomonas populi TaxID=3121582 RepID=A0ABT1X147_9PROT|nr:hypothetical protein [Roseomonas pecuniae]MCR0981824.1 hypothetical protein [Roseomonas pecuniae]